MATKKFAMPQPTKTTPKDGTAYFTLNITRRAKKLNSFKVLRRVWVGSKADKLALTYNNIFKSSEAAKAARADFLKALANHN
jgi:hypothetical protein